MRKLVFIFVFLGCAATVSQAQATTPTPSYCGTGAAQCPVIAGGTGATTAAGAMLNLANVTQASTTFPFGQVVQSDLFNGALGSEGYFAQPVGTTTYLGDQYSEVGNVPTGFFRSFTAFGDSITQGTAATDIGVNNWVALLGYQLNLTPNNLGVGGDQVADEFPIIYGQTYSTFGPTDHALITYQIGTNDRDQYGSSADLEQNLSMMQAAQLAYIGTNGSNQFPVNGGANCTHSSGWTTSSYFSMGLTSSTTGATVTCSGLLGDVTYAATTMVDGASGQFSLAEDAQTVAADSYYPYSYPFGNVDITTGHGATFGDQLIRLQAVPENVNGHTLTLTVVSGTVSVDWMAGNFHSQYAGSPVVLMAGPVPSTGTYQSLNNLSQQYGKIFDGNVKMLAQDGLKVVTVPVYGYMDSNGDDITTIDDIHPTNLGHFHIFQAYWDAIGSFLKQPQTWEQNGVFSAGAPTQSLTLGPGTYLNYQRTPGTGELMAVGAPVSPSSPYPQMQLTACAWGSGNCQQTFWTDPNLNAHTFGALTIGGTQWAVGTPDGYFTAFAQENHTGADTNILIPATNGGTMVVTNPSDGSIGLSFGSSGPMLDAFNAMAPSLGIAEPICMQLGVALTSSNNGGYFCFVNAAGSGNAANYMEFGVSGLVKIDGNNNLTIPGPIIYNHAAPATNTVVCYKAGGVLGWASNTSGVIGTTCN